MSYQLTKGISVVLFASQGKNSINRGEVAAIQECMKRRKQLATAKISSASKDDQSERIWYSHAWNLHMPLLVSMARMSWCSQDRISPDAMKFGFECHGFGLFCVCWNQGSG